MFDLKPVPADIKSEVLAGLGGASKSLPSKFFYNEAGSRLFELITTLPDYYLTRTELGIFNQHMPDIATSVGPGACVVEYGSGSSMKIRKVLEEVHPLAYVPVDISGDHLLEMARSLAGDFPGLAIYPTCADFTGPIDLPTPVAGLPKVGFFPGSSIGNFDPTAALGFLNQVRATLDYRERSVQRFPEAEINHSAWRRRGAFSLGTLSRPCPENGPART